MTPEELSHARHMIEHTAFVGPVLSSKLIAHIDEQAAQIETLKRLLIEEYAINICSVPSNWQNEGEQVKAYFRMRAKEYVTARYPEAMK